MPQPKGEVYNASKQPRTLRDKVFNPHKHCYFDITSWKQTCNIYIYKMHLRCFTYFVFFVFSDSGSFTAKKWAILTSMKPLYNFYKHFSSNLKKHHTFLIFMKEMDIKLSNNISYNTLVSIVLPGAQPIFIFFIFCFMCY